MKHAPGIIPADELQPGNQERKDYAQYGVKPDEERVHPIFREFIKSIRGDYCERHI